ncbi:hypothetical protein I4U23_013594 [Adineta vaga]|nr:hypothetical protein I4U23_013594 [Adineta vaga]
MSNMPEHKREFGLPIADAIKKVDDLATSCPPSSFFYNGSCFFYLPPKQLDNLKGIGFSDVTVDEEYGTSDRCHFFRAKLWDIETVTEFDYVLGRIYDETQSFDSPRIAVNFTHGKHVLKLHKRMNGEQQFLSVGNINDYSLIYKSLPDVPAANTCLIIDISKATRRVSLEEKFRLERRSNHYICKMKINSCFNNTRCGQHGTCKNLVIKYKCICNFMYTGDYCDELSSHGIQSIIGLIFICIAILILLFHSSFRGLHRLKDKKRSLINKNNLMSTINTHRLSRDKFYSIPNISSDQLIADDGLKNPAFANDNESSNNGIHVPHTIVHLRRCSLVSSSISSTSSSSSSSSTAIFFRHSFFYYFWRLFICFLTILFATICCYTVYELKITNLHAYQKLHNTTDKKPPNICKLFQSNLSAYYKIPANYVSIGLLILLILTQIFFENFSSGKKSTAKTFWQHLSIPMVFNSHSHIYRFQSAAVFGIIALDILHIFDEYIINGAKHFRNGPLVDLIIQFGIGLMLENIISYGLSTVYLCCEIVFKIQADANCAIDKTKASLIASTTEKLNQMGINVKQYMIERLGTNRTNVLNETYENTRLWYNNRIETYTTNLTYDDTYEIENELTRLNFSLELNKQSILYNILRNAPYYYFISYLTVCLIILFLKACRNQYEKSPSYQSLPRWKYIKYNLLKTSKYIHTNNQHEYSRLFRCLNSLIFFIKQHIYTIRPYFRYSKLIVCIYISAFTLVYYFTFWIQDHTYILTKKLLLFLNLILCGLADLSKDLCYNLNLDRINQDIQYICFLTALITFIQLFSGLKHYQTQMCNAYRGIYEDIPQPKHISSVTIISRSVHYPGRFMVFFARLDYSAYGRGLEMYDTSYASYVSFFHIERNQRHPVLNVFIDIIRQRLIDIRKFKLRLSMEPTSETYEREKLTQLARFRWALAYTLIHNEQLKRYRKHRLCTTKTVQSKTLERLFDKIGLSQTLPRKY